jgi:hypothetical protein
VLIPYTKLLEFARVVARIRFREVSVVLQDLLKDMRRSPLVYLLENVLETTIVLLQNSAEMIGHQSVTAWFAVSDEVDQRTSL